MRYKTQTQATKERISRAMKQRYARMSDTERTALHAKISDGQKRSWQYAIDRPEEITMDDLLGVGKADVNDKNTIRNNNSLTTYQG